MDDQQPLHDTTSPLECSSRWQEGQNELVVVQSVNQSLVQSLSALMPVLSLPRQNTSAAVNDAVSEQLFERPLVEDDQMSCDLMIGDMDLDQTEEGTLLEPHPSAPVDGEMNAKLSVAATTNERMSTQGQ